MITNAIARRYAKALVQLGAEEGAVERFNTELAAFNAMLADNPARELQQLAGHRLVEAMDARNAVADGDNGAGLGNLDLFPVLLDLLPDNLADLFRSDFHRKVYPFCNISSIRFN